jgi:CRISPR-associated protein Csx17
VDKLGNTCALRLALAIADQCGQHHGFLDTKDTLRHHWQALDGHVPEHQRFAERADTGVLPDLADPLDWLARLVRLRAVRESPLVPRTHVVGLSDLAAFVRGDSDANAGAVFDLLGPCLALDRSAVERLSAPPATAGDLGGLATYGLLRLATLPNGLELSGRRVAIPCDHQVTLALCAGSIDRAVDLAVRRLRHARLRPFIERTFGGADQARLLAAALAIPLHHGDAARLALRLTKPSVTDVVTTNV